MNTTYGARDIVRNPSLLKIDKKGSFIVEDKRAHQELGVYLGIDLAKEFFEYKKKKELLKSARKIKASASEENLKLEESIGDGL